jgi:hypothetical protein
MAARELEALIVKEGWTSREEIIAAETAWKAAIRFAEVKFTSNNTQRDDITCRTDCSYQERYRCTMKHLDPSCNCRIR